MGEDGKNEFIYFYMHNGRFVQNLYRQIMVLRAVIGKCSSKHSLLNRWSGLDMGSYEKLIYYEGVDGNICFSF